MAYRVKMIYPSGAEEYEDEIFETEEAAEEYGSYMASCFYEGGEILRMMGEEPSEGRADYEVEEV